MIVHSRANTTNRDIVNPVIVLALNVREICRIIVYSVLVPLFFYRHQKPAYVLMENISHPSHLQLVQIVMKHVPPVQLEPQINV